MKVKVEIRNDDDAIVGQFYALNVSPPQLPGVIVVRCDHTADITITDEKGNTYYRVAVPR